MLAKAAQRVVFVAGTKRCPFWLARDWAQVDAQKLLNGTRQWHFGFSQPFDSVWFVIASRAQAEQSRCTQRSRSRFFGSRPDIARLRLAGARLTPTGARTRNVKRARKPALRFRYAAAQCIVAFP
jgi:hypothetical protein